MIAVLVPARNCAHWIAEALRSVAAQSPEPDEILLYDDGSTDGTAEVAESLGIPRLRVLRGAAPGGISAALNRMLDATTARFLVRMDADDISEPDRLRTQLAAVEAGNLAVVGSWARRFGKADTVHRFAAEDEDLKAGLLFAAPFCHPTVIIDRQRLRDPSLLRYDSAFDGAEDHELWIRLRNEGRYGNVQRTLLRWRLHSDNAGSHPEKLARQLEVQSRLRQRILDASGVSLDEAQLSALGKRCSSVVLAPREQEPFLGALELLLAGLPRATGTSPDSVRKVLGNHWDLSCHFALHTQAGIPSLWRRGRKRLGLDTPTSTLARMVLKSLLRRGRRTGAPPAPGKA